MPDSSAPDSVTPPIQRPVAPSPPSAAPGSTVSLSRKVGLFVGLAMALAATIILGWNYIAMRRSLYDQMMSRGTALADEIGYAFEVLVGYDDDFSLQRVVEQTATLADVRSVVVADRAGVALAHDDQRAVGDPLDQPLVRRAIDEESRFTSFSGDHFVIADPLHGETYSQEHRSDVVGAVWIEMDLTPLHRRLRGLYLALTSVFVAVSALTLGALVFGVRHLVLSRLAAVVRGLQRIRDGDLTHRLRSLARGGPDEMDALISHFNHMARSLQQQRAELTEAEAFYRALFEQSRDALVVTDTEGRCVDLNPAALSLSGYTREQLLGEQLSAWAPPDDHAATGRTIHRLVSNRGGMAELMIETKDKRQLDVEITIAPLRHRGRPAYLGSLRDISQRKRAENLLRVEHDCAAALSGATELHAALHRLLDRLLDLPSVDSGGVYVVDDATSRLSLAVHSGLSKPFVEAVASFDPGTFQHGLVARGRPIYAEHAQIAQRQDDVFRRAEGLRAMAVIPVDHRGDIIAAVNIASHTHDRIPRRTRQAIESVAAQVGGAIARLKAESTLHQSQENLQTLFNTIDDLLFILDTDGQVLRVNAAVERRLAYSEEELLALNVLDLHPAGRRDEVARVVAAMLRGEATTCDIPLITRDGSPIPVETKVTRGRWGGQDVLFGLSRDVTERRRAERALEDQAARQEALLSSSPALVYLKDRDLTYLAANEPFADMVGLDDTAIAGKTDLDLFPRHQAQAYRRDDRRVMESGEPLLDREEPVTGRDGVERWMLTSKVPYKDAEGRVIGVVGTTFDISARKAAEEALKESEIRHRAIVEAIPDLMLQVDRAGRIVDCETRDIEPCFKLAADHAGQHLADVLPAETVESLLAMVERTLDTGTPQTTRFTVRSGDGEQTFQAQMALLGPDHTLMVVRDISERARLERMKSDFINRASHELRTPITTALLMADLVDEGGPEDETNKAWSILKTELKRQQTLIEKLLTVGRLDSGRFDVSPRAVELGSVLRPALAAVEAQAESKALTLSESIPGDLPQVNGEADALEQVFVNLLSNAVKFTPEGGSVTLRAVRRDGGVSVEVTDTGIGIPPEDMDHLFERFVRGQNAIRQEIPGTGVGLYIVKAVTEALRGRVTVDTAVGDGTTFEVWLPRWVDADTPECDHGGMARG